MSNGMGLLKLYTLIVKGYLQKRCKTYKNIKDINVMIRWNGRVYNFLTFPAIWCQIPSAQGHVTHKVSSEHAQTTGSSD